LRKKLLKFYIRCLNSDTSESRSEILGKFLKYGAGEGWRRTVGLIM
jgi:hypothetical protein